jgi:hypothetical protein
MIKYIKQRALLAKLIYSDTQEICSIFLTAWVQCLIQKNPPLGSNLNQITVVPPYPLIQYPRFNRGPKKDWKIKEINKRERAVTW